MPTTQYPPRVQFAQPPPPVGAAWTCLILAWFFILMPIPILSWLLGWTFGLIAFILEIIVIARGAPGVGILQILAQMFLTPIVYIYGVALFAEILK